MVFGIFSSPSQDHISIGDEIEKAKANLEKASKEEDFDKASKLCKDAKKIIKSVEKTAISKETPRTKRILGTIGINKNHDHPCHEGIADAYHRLGVQLDALGRRKKARESYAKAEEWGYVATKDPTGVTSSAAPKNPMLRVPKILKDISHVQLKVFKQAIAPPVSKHDLPEFGGQITSTPQLAYCLALMKQPLELLDEVEIKWVKAMAEDERDRLQAMATDLIRAFVRDELKKSDVVAEVVCLSPVLDQDDFRKLLLALVDGINQSVLLQVHLLDGLSQLLRNSKPGSIDADDLVKILETLSERLKGTHGQSVQNIYRLALAVSRVLDSMVDSQVERLKREQLHEPLSDYMKELQENSDPYLVYQAAYAYQAIQYIPDDESILQAMLRRTGKVIQGISGLVSAVNALDIMGFIEGLHKIQDGLQNLHKGLEDAGKVVEYIQGSYQNASEVLEGGKKFLECLKEGLSFSRKSSWYPALRGLDSLLQEARIGDFEKLIRKAPCRGEPAFQWGVCQRLGELASSKLWDTNTRQCALIFLKRLYNKKWNQENVKLWILYILHYLGNSAEGIIGKDARDLRKLLDPDDKLIKTSQFKAWSRESICPYSSMAAVALQTSPLLDCVLNKPDVDSTLNQLKRERLRDRGNDVYIPPRAKASLQGIEEFDLTSKAQEFLDSEGKVFLLLGDSGAGKSTFNRALEISLWEKYEKDGRIPLFIHLPAIENPEQDLIAKRLRMFNFTAKQIQELKANRKVILICDGYDESQTTQNFYKSNNLNEPGGWRAQMIISCRTDCVGINYKDHFQPTDRNTGGDSELFQESVIVPFSPAQIQHYINKYVTLKKPLWGSETYKEAINQIPNLKDMIKNPFLLKLALEVLPEIDGIRKGYSEVRITRIELYDRFVMQWLERSRIRFTDMKLHGHDGKAFKWLLENGFQEQGISYLKELAVEIYNKQGGSPVISYLDKRDLKSWKGRFFNKKERRNLLQDAVPLNRKVDEYRFIHKSILEYGLTIAIIGPKADEMITSSGLSPSLHETSNPALRKHTTMSDAKTPSDMELDLLNSPLGKMDLVREPPIILFLVERVQQQPVFMHQLLSIIQRSKTDLSARTAATNAITILVRAGVQFNGADLRGIRIPGADLSYGVFDSARFDGADLRLVKLRNTWLRHANLSRAKMKGVRFCELPFLQEKAEITCSAYSPDGKWYAVGLLNGNISLYGTLTWYKRSFSGHTSQVSSIAFSGSSSILASGSRDGTVRVWDLNKGQNLYTFNSNSSVTNVVYSPRGDAIACASDDNVARIWKFNTKEEVTVLRGHSKTITSLAYSPKGDKIAIGSRNRTVMLWDVSNGQCLHDLQGHTEDVLSVAYSPKGDQIASGGVDMMVILWDVKTGARIRTLSGHTDFINNVIYSPNGNQIASASLDTTIRLWDAESGGRLHTLIGHTEMVTSLTYSSKGDQIASGSRDKSVRLWSVESGSCLHTLHGHSGSIKSVLYSPKGHQIVSGSDDATVRLWSAENGDIVRQLQGHAQEVNSAMYSSRGDRLVSGGSDCTVRLWHVETGNNMYTFHGHSKRIDSVAYSPKGIQVASGSRDNTVRLWDMMTGNCAHILQGHGGWITSVVYSPTKGDQIATGSYDKTVRLWDTKTGKNTHTLNGHQRQITSIAYSPGGDKIVSGSQDKTARLWDSRTGIIIHILMGHKEWINSIAYSPKGDRIASGSKDWTIRLWDVETGKTVHTLEGHSGEVTAVIYLQNGEQIASSSKDKTIRLWDVETGSCIHTLVGHKQDIASVAYSPDGELIASGSDDGTVRLWSADTGRCLDVISGFNGSVRGIAWEYSCNGQYMATVSEDKSVRRWELIKVENQYRFRLLWSSSHEVLTLSDADFTNVQGLTESNWTFLGQRGILVNSFKSHENIDSLVWAQVYMHYRK